MHIHGHKFEVLAFGYRDPWKDCNVAVCPFVDVEQLFGASLRVSHVLKTGSTWINFRDDLFLQVRFLTQSKRRVHVNSLELIIVVKCC